MYLLQKALCLIAEGVGDVGLDAVLEGGAGDEGKGALAGEEVVVDDATEGDHGKTAVLDLLEAHGGHVLLAETEGVEHEVSGLAAAALHGFVDSGEGGELEEADPEEELGHGGGLVVACIPITQHMVSND